MKTKSLFALLIILCLSLSLFACSDNNSNSGRKEKLSKTAMTINNTNINALEFQIYFHTVYNNFLNSTSGGSNYGLDSSKSLNEQSCGIAGYTNMTWAQYFSKSTESYCQELYGIVAEANAESYEMTQEEKDSLSKQTESFKESMKNDAKANNQCEEESIATLYGKDVTYEDIQKANTNMALYSSYINAKTVKSYTDEEINDYYQQNKNNIDTLTLRVAPIFYITDPSQNNPYGYENKETALEKANEFASRVTSEESYLQLLDEYMNDKVKEYYGSSDYTMSKNVDYSTFSNDPEGVSWAFDENRVKGDIKVIDNKSSYLVVFYISRDTKDYNYVDVRDILVKDLSDLGKKKAEDIYNEWRNGTQTEESFAKLAEKYSEDTGSNKNGGLYTNRGKGDFVEALDEWCFNPDRKPGDNEVIFGKYGYYIMYYSKSGSNARKTLVEKAIQNERYSSLVKSVIEKYPYTTYISVMLSVIS